MARVRMRSDRDVEDDEALRTRLPGRSFSPLRNIGVRIFIALGALAATAFIVYAERECYTDRGETGPGALTLLDSFYYATVTLSTTGYGDITPVCDSARLVNILVITPLRFLFLIVLVGTTIEVLTQRTREEFRTARWRRTMHDHTVVIGFGVKGRSAARTLRDSGLDPLSIVVVSPDAEAVSDANRMGFVGVVGDARREDVLREAAIERSSKVVVATDQDDTSILVTLTARRLAPHAQIVASAREVANAEVLRQSGANTVITTAESSGNLLGLSLLSPTAGDLMEDLLDSGRGLEIVERAITREELGVPPAEIDEHGEIVLAVIRGADVHRFHQKDIDSLQRNDRVVVVRHTPPE